MKLTVFYQINLQKNNMMIKENKLIPALRNQHQRPITHRKLREVRKHIEDILIISILKNSLMLGIIKELKTNRRRIISKDINGNNNFIKTKNLKINKRKKISNDFTIKLGINPIRK